ncbi:MAG: PhzF family phenazine biosynthesis protein [Geminicoccaceae bacterium]|nr:PhzF family phenazine biosynthesis protein [Geminicoccaceae bacterium]MDW8369249.1 PhzF family phenazine biosynthesis protein [Geminicoccaceae bacterium]
MRWHFLTLDVFTDRRFTGNPLAVLPEAAGLDAAQMQRIAREFGCPETVFVLPPDDPAHLARLRIFTPAREVPFAGHPTIGTALALARLGRVQPDEEGRARIVLEELAGPVPVTIAFEGGRAIRAELTAPQRPSHGPRLEPAPIAAALGLEPGDLAADGPTPCTASCGLSFLMVELGSRDALARARLDAAAAEPLPEPAVYLFTRATDVRGIEVRARMLAPRLGVAEDPATGSAAAALAGLLAATDPRPDGDFAWHIEQGVEMGRPSFLAAHALKRAGRVIEARVAGGAVAVMEGTIEVG